MSYYQACVQMEKMGVNPEYILGWQNGYWLHPMREEQRVNDAYTAGYNDGKAQTTDNFNQWLNAA